MSTRFRWIGAAALAFALCGLAAQARLPVKDFSVLPDDPFDDVQASLRLSFDTWGPPVADANRIAIQAGVSTDDFAAMAFLSNRSGVGLSALWGYRSSGLSWGQIAVTVGVPWDVIVIQPSRDYGPPYGKAWGYWKKGGNARRGFSLTDREFLRMVEVHTLMKATGRHADDVIQELQGGKKYRVWAGDTWREKHGHGPKDKAAKGQNGTKAQKPHKSGGRGKGKSK